MTGKVLDIECRRRLLADLVAGAIAGLWTDSLLHPLDTITTRLWVQRTAKDQNILEAFKQLIRSEGHPALYKGFFTVITLSPIGHGLYYSTYNFAKNAMRSRVPHKQFDVAVHATSGLCANFVGALAWTPMDVVKIQQQATVGNCFTSPVDGLIRTYSKAGLRNGIFRGYWAGLATYGPFSAAYFVVYEQCKLSWAQFRGVTFDRLTAANHFVGGLIAGSVAAWLTAPIDAIKTRMQVLLSGGLASNRRTLLAKIVSASRLLFVRICRNLIDASSGI